MENLKCPACNRKPVDPINLRCDHHPCFECASQIIAIDQQSLQTKYRIICPACHKKTITYDLRHLIINNTEQDEDLYVTAKFINKKPDICVAKKANNYIQSTSGRNSLTSKHGSHNPMNSASRPVSIECKKHTGHYLQYFCQECCEKGQNTLFMCSECAKNHKHRLIALRSASQKICISNQKRRQTSFRPKFQFLQQVIGQLMGRKQKINHEFENLYKQISDQFKTLYHYINEQYEQIKKQIKFTYTKQCEQIRNNLGLAEKLKQSLEELDKIPTHGCNQIEAQIHYSLCYYDIERALEANKIKLAQKFQIPKLLKRKALVFSPSQRLFEIQTHRRQGSRAITPTNSARIINYSMEGLKSGKQEQNTEKIPQISIYKQNSYFPVSPKNYFSSKPNI